MDDRLDLDFGLGEIGQIAVPVTDMERSLPFYRDVLGIRFLFKAPPGLAFFNCGGVRLLLDEPAAKQGKIHSSIIYFRVTNLKTAYSTLTGRGVIFEQEPRLVAKMPDHELWMAFFRDPDANLLALMSEVR
jgi:methylmalonyl-CoA/ethylmalonyl-CoA epimerase